MKTARWASLVLGLAAACCGALLSYLILRSGFSADRIAWYAGPALLVLFFLAALRFPAIARVQIASMLIATVAALYAAELVLARTADSRSPERSAAEAAGIPFDTRSKLEVVQQFRQEGVRAFPAVHGRLFRLERSDRRPLSIVVDGEKKLPLAGPSNQVVVVCNESGSYLTYRSDEYGFHNPRGAWSQPVVEFAAVGDSYTHGACVPSGQGLVAQLRAQGATALNLGLDGNGPLAMLGAIREYLFAVKPRAVLWVYYETNDLADLEEEKGNAVLARYLEPGFAQGLRQAQPEISQQLVQFLESALQDEISTERTEVLKLSHLRTSLGLRRFNPIQGTKPADPEACCDVASLGRALQVARDDVHGWGGELYFVYLPGWRRYFAPAELAAPERARAAVLDEVSRLGIPHIDVAEAFAAQPAIERMFAYPGPYSHYSARGYRVVSEAILAGVPRGRGP